ncbi:MAG: hypothetical protein QF879_17275, partial [Candidatus Latescibacteria bacterium]|nr:hypothetical protein [Candidatus Latescibacterota bacterium]
QAQLQHSNTVDAPVICQGEWPDTHQIGILSFPNIGYELRNQVSIISDLFQLLFDALYPRIGGWV